MVLANLQRGAFDEAERELKLTTPRTTDEPWDMSMFDTAVRAEIALGRGDVEEGLFLWRTAAAALRGPKPPGRTGQPPGPAVGRPDLSRLEPWALDLQAMAVVCHAQHGRLDLVAEITGLLPATLSVLTAEMGPPPGSPLASYPSLPVCGSLLLALAVTDIDRARRADGAGGAAGADGADLIRLGARMIALAERFGIQHGFGPTSSAARARRAAQDADGPAYDDAVSSYAGLDPEALRGAARDALRERARLC
jgi:hypothetical protein